MMHSDDLLLGYGCLQDFISRKPFVHVKPGSAILSGIMAFLCNETLASQHLDCYDGPVRVILRCKLEEFV